MKRLLLALTLTLGVLLVGGASGAATHHRPEATAPCTVGPDQTAKLQALANALSNKVLTLPDQCYNVSGTLTITNVSNETIDGNGAVLDQEVAPWSSSPHPLLKLVHDTNLTITNLTIEGAKTPTTGGEFQEGDFGVQLEADTNVSLAGVTVKNTLGDWVYLSPPLDVKGSNALNTGISFSGDTFLNAGYHGFTVESVGCPTAAPCNGLTVSSSTMTSMPVDAMDFEYDDYPTAFKNGLPQQAAEDFITFEGNTWTNWTDDWYASVQDNNGPGVQEQRVSLIDNTLDSSAPLFEVDGTPTYETSPPYLNAYLTVTGNTFGAGYHATGWRGGNTPVGSIHSVAGLIMEHNTFPVTGLRDELDLYNISYSVVEQNTFAGAQGVVEPQAYNESDTHLLVCGNHLGAQPVTACLY